MIEKALFEEITEETRAFITQRLKESNLHISLENASFSKDNAQFSIKISVDKDFNPESKRRYISKCESLGLHKDLLNNPFEGVDGRLYEVIGANPSKLMPLIVKQGHAKTNMGLQRFKHIHPDYNA